MATLKHECSLINRIETVTLVLYYIYLFSLHFLMLLWSLKGCFSLACCSISCPPAASWLLCQDVVNAIFFFLRSILIKVYCLTEILLQRVIENALTFLLWRIGENNCKNAFVNCLWVMHLTMLHTWDFNLLHLFSGLIICYHFSISIENKLIRGRNKWRLR